MKKIKYFIEFIIISFFFLIFKLLGYKIASNFGAIIGSFFGPFFRSKKTIFINIKKSIPNLSEKQISKISKNMWSNYGRILSDYIYIKDFRNSKLNKFLEIEGNEILDKVKKNKKPVIFISGHFDNFELMAMQIEKSGIKLAAIYRPLNNIFLNKIMEKIRKKHICKNQIKKGISGIRDIIKLTKDDTSIAIMIDQRVSEGIESNFFNRKALTTTIPAQLVKKFHYKVVPVDIKRINKHNFKIKFHKPISFDQDETIESITLKLNKWLETIIFSNPTQWIWSHNRWK